MLPDVVTDDEKSVAMSCSAALRMDVSAASWIHSSR